MIKLRCFGTDGDCFNQFFLNWNYGKTIYKNIEIVYDDSYTHVILFGTPSGVNLKNISKENVIGFQCEPQEIHSLKNYIDYAEKYIGTYYGSLNHGTTFKKEITYLPPYPLQLVKADYGESKKFPMSFVASDKNQLVGHQLRHKLIDKLLQTDLDIHFYGRNLNRMHRYDQRIKGTVENKFETALVPYMFTVSIENVIEDFYTTEKFYDPILAECIPIYWGEYNGKYSGFYDLAARKVSDSCLYLNKLKDQSIDNMVEHIKHIYAYAGKYYNSKEQNYELKRAKRVLMDQHAFGLCELVWKRFNIK